MFEDNWRSYLTSCSNEGRWGKDDERGTLNYISPAVTLAALQLVTAGEVVALGHQSGVPITSVQCRSCRIGDQRPLARGHCLDQPSRVRGHAYGRRSSCLGR